MVVMMFRLTIIISFFFFFFFFDAATTTLGNVSVRLVHIVGAIERQRLRTGIGWSVVVSIMLVVIAACRAFCICSCVRSGQVLLRPTTQQRCGLCRCYTLCGCWSMHA